MSRGAYAIRDALRAGRSGIPDDLRKEGQIILADLRASLSTLFPPPSAPGQAPHRRTGNLEIHYAFQVLTVSTTVYVLAVYSPTEYAVYTELGTRYMAPRPHLRPCIARNYVTLQTYLRTGIETRERASR